MIFIKYSILLIIALSFNSVKAVPVKDELAEYFERKKNVGIPFKLQQPAPLNIFDYVKAKPIEYSDDESIGLNIDSLDSSSSNSRSDPKSIKVPFEEEDDDDLLQFYLSDDEYRNGKKPIIKSKLPSSPIPPRRKSYLAPCIDIK